MSSDWRHVRTEELIASDALLINDGYRAKNSEMGTDGLPFARAGNINGQIGLDDTDVLAAESVRRAGEKLSEPGDTVFTSKGTVGRFAFVRQDTPRFVYSPQLCFWRVKNERVLDRRFVFFWLQGLEARAQLNSLKGQTDMADYVSLRDQRTMTMTLPPIEEQRRIAGVLGALDDKIEHNRTRGVRLALLARLEFDRWFRSLSDAPRVDVAELVASGVLVVNDGYRAKNSEMAADGVPFLRGRNVNDDVDLEGADLLGLDGVRRAKDKVSRVGDAFFTAKGTVGRIGRVSRWTPKFVYSPQIAFWRSLDDHALASDYLYLWLGSTHFIEQRDAVKGQTDMADYVNLRDQRAMTIVVAPPASQRELESIVRPLLDSEALSRAESRRLAAVRDALLPRLISGQIRVPESYDPDDVLGTVIEQAAAR